MSTHASPATAEREVPPRTEQRTGLRAARGLAIGIGLSIPLWAGIIAAIRAFL
ncbi:MAG TPA: hypothetical protein VFA63_16550 [Pseudonocardiaceae bacterium]|nr:hypothetical protein [Pseudonocardiaceae bacterium]